MTISCNLQDSSLGGIDDESEAIRCDQSYEEVLDHMKEAVHGNSEELAVNMAIAMYRTGLRPKEVACFWCQGKIELANELERQS